MSEDHEESPSQRLRNGGAGKLSYLGENGESFFIRTSGKGDFKIFNLISRATFALVDVFFSSEEEARLFAHKRNLRIVAFDDNTSLASHGQAR